MFWGKDKSCLERITIDSDTNQETSVLKESQSVLGGSDGKKPACSTGDLGSITGWGRSPGGGHGNPLQYPCLENPTDRGAWQVMVHEVAKSWTRLKLLSTHAHCTEDQ